ncbi:cell division protein FtsL [Vibrio sp. SCSIO 43135]|uniref:Cell division protein FtsL n=1 Tax=Vibrio paucivorans TaxID=2829489 RepID=A0A9X3CBL7_9VIBR|nr:MULTISPECIES: cell division protein FtsL [Vibrio]MCW8332707.1 cell division protein FtsL [Vibrio paucivorans]USD41625.1 cell division protein FtsL [Vibrio sp. SCSIO 43135]
MSRKAPNLAKLIAQDLFTVGRVPMVLLVLIFASAMGVVFVTHHSRQAISEKDQMLLERDRLGSEWRNLILEETALADHSRVQALAKRELEMKRPDADKEVVINLQ